MTIVDVLRRAGMEVVVAPGPKVPCASRGPGTALEFALSLVEKLLGAETANDLRARMLVAF